MPTHAILVTYQNMVTHNVISEFVTKAQAKYAANFKQLYFDSGTLKGKLFREVSSVPAADKLKIYVSGHGGTGIDYITDDSQSKKQTVQDLAKLLAWALHQRATDPNTSANTEVNMISCLFGRTPDGSANRSPAAKLHRELFERGVFVDLVARTESIIVLAAGRTTIPPSRSEYVARNIMVTFAEPKAQYTKIRCTFLGGSPIVKLRAYQHGDDVYIHSDSLAAKRSLWADHAVDLLMKQIHPKRSATEATGAVVTDSRELVLKGIVDLYAMNRRPDLLYDRLSRLVDGQGVGAEANFTQHRNLLSSVFSKDPPKKSVVVKDIVKAYPVLAAAP